MTKAEMTEIAHMMFDLLKPVQEDQIERALGEIPYRIENYLRDQLSGELRVLVAKTVRETVVVQVTVKDATV